MKLTKVRIWQLEVIASFVAFRELIVDTSAAVKRLMEVADVVDKEPHGHRLARDVGAVSRMVHDDLVSEAVLMTRLVLEPGNKVRNNRREILIVELEIWIVLD